MVNGVGFPANQRLWLIGDSRIELQLVVAARSYLFILKARSFIERGVMLWCGWFYSTPWAYNLPPLMGMQQWTVRVFAGENSREILKDERFTVFLVFDFG